MIRPFRSTFAGQRIRSSDGSNDYTLMSVDLSERAWVARAACGGFHDPELFYEPPSSQLYELALDVLGEMCLRCPVFEDCLADTLAYETQQSRVHGFRAGLTEEQRRGVLSGHEDLSLLLAGLTSARTYHTMETSPS